MRIGIVGLGAIGGWIAGRLALAGNAVSTVARGATLDALNAGELRICEGDDDRTVRIQASADPSALGRQDLLVISVKAPALPMRRNSAVPMIGPDTLILPMLNGVPWWFVPAKPLRSIDPDGRIAASLPQAQLVGCVVHAACRRPGPAESKSFTPTN